MNKIWFLVFTLIIFSVIAGCSPDAAADSPVVEDESEIVASSNEGKELLESRCTECHTLGKVESASKTSEEWQSNVERMVLKGASLNEEEQGILIEYLSETYGK
ncbi:MAG: hypothetical protein JEZ06_19615 [Anaerolineaceae bacterium]|nr:hypothetical protein [Anaerolineaceae bacterium]